MPELLQQLEKAQGLFMQGKKFADNLNFDNKTMDFDKWTDKLGPLIHTKGSTLVTNLVEQLTDTGLDILDDFVAVGAGMASSGIGALPAKLMLDKTKDYIKAAMHNAIGSAADKLRETVGLDHFTVGEFVALHRGEAGISRRRLGFWEDMEEWMQPAGYEKGVREVQEKAIAAEAKQSKDKLDLGMVLERESEGRVLVRDIQTGEEYRPGVSDVDKIPAAARVEMDNDPILGGMKAKFFKEAVGQQARPQANQQFTGASTVKGSMALLGSQKVKFVEMLDDGRCIVEVPETGQRKYVDYAKLGFVNSITTNNPTSGQSTGFMQSVGFNVGEFVWYLDDAREKLYCLGVLISIGENTLDVCSAMDGQEYTVNRDEIEHINTNVYTQVERAVFTDFQLAVNERRADSVIQDLAIVIMQEHSNEIEALIDVNHEWFARVGETDGVIRVDASASGKPRFKVQTPQNVRGHEDDQRRELEREFGKNSVEYREFYGPRGANSKDIALGHHLAADAKGDNTTTYIIAAVAIGGLIFIYTRN